MVIVIRRPANFIINANKLKETLLIVMMMIMMMMIMMIMMIMMMMNDDDDDGGDHEIYSNKNSVSTRHFYSTSKRYHF